MARRRAGPSFSIGRSEDLDASSKPRADEELAVGRREVDGRKVERAPADDPRREVGVDHHGGDAGVRGRAEAKQAPQEAVEGRVDSRDAITYGATLKIRMSPSYLEREDGKESQEEPGAGLDFKSSGAMRAVLSDDGDA